MWKNMWKTKTSFNSSIKDIYYRHWLILNNEQDLCDSYMIKCYDWDVFFNAQDMCLKKQNK